MPLSASDLLGMQTTENDFLPDVLTIPRTGAVTHCRLGLDRRPVPLKDMPQGVSLARFRLAVPAGTDFRSGDRGVVTGKGTYLVLIREEPRSIDLVEITYVLQTNAQVTFARPSANASTGSVDVHISRVSEQMKTYGILYDWDVWYSSDIRYSGSPTGGALISAGDQITWARSPNPFPGVSGTLDKPRYAYAPDSALVAAMFKEGR